MCLLIFAHHVAPDYPLVFAANRDEFHARPTAPSAFWDDHPGLLAGRDLEQGGTWMGITRSGRFAAVTNYRDPARTAPAPRSRGELTVGYLAGDMSPGDYLQQLAGRAADYAGFNLLLGDETSLWYYANSGDLAPRELAPGIYGLSNARLDTPWPKVELGKARLRGIMDNSPAGLSHEHLGTVVADRDLADISALGQLGQDSEMEQLLSAQFIVTPGYGTRSRTTLWCDAGGGVEWCEQGFDPAGEATALREERFRKG